MANHDRAVETSGLSKRFGVRAVVDDVALRVPRGWRSATWVRTAPGRP